MNILSEPLLWCVIQTTLVGLLACALCVVVRRWSAASHVAVPATALAAIVALTICAFVPWPSWWQFGPSLNSWTFAADATGNRTPQVAHERGSALAETNANESGRTAIEDPSSAATAPVNSIAELTEEPARPALQSA